MTDGAGVNVAYDSGEVTQPLRKVLIASHEFGHMVLHRKRQRPGH